MDSLLTPTTALLHSLLETSAFETPRVSQILSPGEPDVFSSAFGEHTTAQQLEADHWTGADGYISPARTNIPSSTGVQDDFTDQELQSTFPALPDCVVLPSPEEIEEFLGSFCHQAPREKKILESGFVIIPTATIKKQILISSTF